ncbi:MAG: PIN domain-containing protein [Nocardioides sp.]
MNLLDSSALLAYLLDEPGADVVTDCLAAGSRVSAANWSEVAQKSRAAGRNWEFARRLLLAQNLVVEPVTADDAERAAAIWISRPSLSLADRLCLASGERLAATVWTADREWGAVEPVRQIR